MIEQTLLRDDVLDRLREDLVGPGASAEILPEAASSRYLTGILYPQSTAFSPEEDETIPESNASDGGEEPTAPAPAMVGTFKPSACGFSFGVEQAGLDTAAVIALSVRYGRYEKEGTLETDDAETARRAVCWRRKQYEIEGTAVELDIGSESIIIAEGLRLFRRVVRRDGALMVTLQFVNEFHQNENGDTGLFVGEYDDREAATFFQFEAEVSCADGCRFVPRPRLRQGTDRDERVADLIYADAAEYAVGHTASASWSPADAPKVIRLTWTPTSRVKRMDPSGDASIPLAVSRTRLGRLAPLDIASCSADVLSEGLAGLCEAYEAWIEAREGEVPMDTAVLEGTARDNLADCREALRRMREGAALLEADVVVRQAFQSANRAMLIQAAWQGFGEGAFPNAHRDLPDFERFGYSWRPFQIGYALMCLSSCASRGSPDRDVMDLIWFPTGGGKTEAYLLLAAFTLFHRRLTLGAAGGGVSVIMRYTLRTLTVQQFQRAAALVTACEVVRSQEEEPYGPEPFRIGLWVGNSTTPNRREDAARSLSSGIAGSSPAQLRDCPCCAAPVTWTRSVASGHFQPACTNADCGLEEATRTLPVLTVDEDIYEAAPSLLIGTVDKFAQIVRNPRSGRLFGVGNDFAPPDLIIQDELHLIGGPLGSLTGLYETAVDRLCETEGGPVKIIGSTATIRRAADQIKSLFDRRSTQFPPPGLSWRNNFFAHLDESDQGRLYVGVSTAGRSEKFALQALSASLMQSGAALAQDERGIDPYYTLVAYFNSLKVLGGALVLMEDDVRATIAALADRRSEDEREIDTPEELTSRKPSSEIPRILEDLGAAIGEPGCVDVLLATNMLSVGVDIPRLGLMLVNGQPKFMSEYIQATSRVGRNTPGLVVTLYNSNKIRDRAHFEAFCGWHAALYRSVEPSSVTPFASRARDKALHAPLMALVIHLVEARTERISESRRPEVERLVETIVSRVSRIDPDEETAARSELLRFVDQWFDAAQSGSLKRHWNDRMLKSSLLISAETAATYRALGRGNIAGKSTPNSMRNVEPSVKYLLKERADP